MPFNKFKSSFLYILINYTKYIKSFAGLVGTSLSLLIRLQLMFPGNVYNKVKENLIIYKKIIKDNKNQKIKLLENKFNTTYTEFLEALSFGSFILIVFRLSYRIEYWGYNPAWYINLIVFLVATIIGIKYSAYDYVREGAVTYIYKPLLGYDYYKNELEEKRLEANNDEEGQFYAAISEITAKPFREKINNLYLYSQYKREITNNAAYIYLFNFLVYFRLLIIKNLYFFMLINFIFVFFLISNKYLILASFFSILVFLSRLTFHLTDYNMEEFNLSIQAIEEINFETEVIIPTESNAKILGYWIARSFHQRELYYAIRREEKKDKKSLNEYLTENAKKNSDIIYYKLIKIKEKMLDKLLLEYPSDYNIKYEGTFCSKYIKNHFKNNKKIIKTKPKIFRNDLMLISYFVILLLFLGVVFYLWINNIENYQKAGIMEFVFKIKSSVNFKFVGDYKEQMKDSKKTWEFLNLRKEYPHAKLGKIYADGENLKVIFFNFSTIKMWDRSNLGKVNAETYINEIKSANSPENKEKQGITTYGIEIIILPDEKFINEPGTISQSRFEEFRQVFNEKINYIEDGHPLNDFFEITQISKINLHYIHSITTSSEISLKMQEKFKLYENSHLKPDEFAMPYTLDQKCLTSVILNKEKTKIQVQSIYEELEINKHIIENWNETEISIFIKTKYHNDVSETLYLLKYMLNHPNEELFFSKELNIGLQKNIYAFTEYNNYLTRCLNNDNEISFLESTEKFAIEYYPNFYKAYQNMTKEEILDANIKNRMHYCDRTQPFSVLIKPEEQQYKNIQIEKQKQKNILKNKKNENKNKDLENKDDDDFGGVD